MQTIYKYPLHCTSTQQLQLPINARILSVSVQQDQIVLWALVDNTENILEDKTIIIHGTGHPVDDINCTFIGTINLRQHLWFHIFYQ